MANLDTLVDELSKLTVLEAAELSKKLEETWGVSAAVPMAVVAAPGAGEAEEAAAEHGAHVGAAAALEQHDEDQHEADEEVKDEESKKDD